MSRRFASHAAAESAFLIQFRASDSLLNFTQTLHSNRHDGAPGISEKTRIRVAAELHTEAPLGLEGMRSAWSSLLRQCSSVSQGADSIETRYDSASAVPCQERRDVTGWRADDSGCKFSFNARGANNRGERPSPRNSMR